MSRFATKRRHWKYAGLFRSTRRAPGHREVPTLYRIAAQGDVSAKPPVRIYVGTEPMQYRAERVFIWSLLKVRDPAREYQVYLMKDLVGFSRSGWKTGFKTYRYAVPSLAGCRGRAIYNDVDQVYLADPAEFFDLDMGGCGVLCVDDRDSSVMLMDCASMGEVWTREDAESKDQHKVFRRAARERGLWGRLPARWHARDAEYEAGKSMLLHFTTLHKQPWHPFPRDIKYEVNEVADVWHALEREADESGFTPWTREHPSDHQLALYELYQIMHEDGYVNPSSKKPRGEKVVFDGSSLKPHLATIGKLVHEYKPATLLDYGSGKGLLYQDSPDHAPGSRHRVLPEWPGVAVTCYDPGHEPFAEAVEGQFDGVISTDMLEHVPEEDVPWLFDELFAHAQRFIYVVAACYPARKNLPDGQNAHCTIMLPEWWAGQIEAAARRHAAAGRSREEAQDPASIAWILCTKERSFLSLKKRRGLFRAGIRSRYFKGTVCAS